MSIPAKVQLGPGYRLVHFSCLVSASSSGGQASGAWFEEVKDGRLQINKIPFTVTPYTLRSTQPWNFKNITAESFTMAMDVTL